MPKMAAASRSTRGSWRQMLVMGKARYSAKHPGRFTPMPELCAYWFTPEDVEAERDVILEEIAMHDDDPDDVVHNLFAAQAWGDTPLGRPIAGTAESIASLTRSQIARFHSRHYRPANMVIAVAGNVDHAAVVRQVRKAFGRNGFLAGNEAPVLKEDFFNSLCAAFTLREIRYQVRSRGLGGLVCELASDRHWIVWGHLPRGIQKGPPP